MLCASRRVVHVVFAAVVALGCCSAGAAEYFATATEVDDATRDCSSEANAGSLTNAMARATADGDVVTLLPGTYDMTKFTPTSGLFFNVPKLITVRSLSEDPTTVTLKGGGTSQPSRCFEFKTTGSEVHGISFTGFYVHNSSVGAVKNGTLYGCVFAGNALFGTAGTCVNGSICHGCTFTDNVYTNSGTHYCGGGAGSGGSYFGCRFERNFAFDSTRGHQSNAGAVWKPNLVSNCVFIGNYATRRGGAVGTDANPVYSCLVVDSFFTNNTASTGGGAVYGVTVSNCVISGSAIRCTEGAAAHAVKAFDCVFVDNICSNYSHWCGGGAAAWGSYYNCRFERNRLVNPGSHQSFGGAILQPNYVSNCVFVSNYSADRGGAIGHQGTDIKYRSVIVDSFFTNNEAKVSAGAILDATLTNCTFSGSTSHSAGAAVQSVKAYGCLFVDNVCSNTSHYSGGGAGANGEYYSCKFLRNKSITTTGHNTRAGALLTPSLVSNCVFVGNSTVWYGGAVYGDSGTTRILDSYFTNNVATYAGGAVHSATVSNCVISGSILTSGENGSGACSVRAYDTLFIGNVLTNGSNTASGGAQALGSAVNCVYRDNLDYSEVIRASAGATFNVAMTNCLVVGNICKNEGNAHYGGSTVWAVSAPCVNCTIASNFCYAASKIGAAAGKFVNCIIVGNVPCDVYNHGNSGTANLSNCVFGTIGANCTIVTNDCRQVASVKAVKFTSIDPADANAFRLTRRSPARDFGLDVGMTAEDRDLDGLPRVYGKAIDAGCYECNIPAPGLLLFCR